MLGLNTRQTETKSETFFAHSHKCIQNTYRLSKYDVFLSEVTMLANNNPEVYASDEHFAIKLGCGIRNIKKYFKKAESQGILYRITTKRRDHEGKIRSHRKVYLTRQNAFTLNMNRGPLKSPLKDKPYNISPNSNSLSRKKSGETHTKKSAPENNKLIAKKVKEQVELPPKKEIVRAKSAPPLRKTENIHKNIIKKDLKMPVKSKTDITFDKNMLKFDGITEKDKQKWIEIYPELKLEAELTRAAKWLADAKLKKKSIRSFLRNWIGRAKEINDHKKSVQEKKIGETHQKNKKTIVTLSKADKFLLNYGLKCTFSDTGIEFEGSKYGDAKYEYLSYKDLKDNAMQMNYTMIGKLIQRGIPLDDARKIVKDHVVPEYKMSEAERQRIIEKNELLRKKQEYAKQLLHDDDESPSRIYYR